jgi:hypothetical protein
MLLFIFRGESAFVGSAIITVGSMVYSVDDIVEGYILLTRILISIPSQCRLFSPARIGKFTPTGNKNETKLEISISRH